MLIYPKFIDKTELPVHNYYLYIVYEFRDNGVPAQVWEFFLKEGYIYASSDCTTKKMIYTNSYHYYVSPFKLTEAEIRKERCSDAIPLTSTTTTIMLPFLCNFVFPVLRSEDEYRHFGWSYEDAQHVRQYHLGRDYKADIGTPVYSIGEGNVIMASQINGFGSLSPATPGGAVVIQHKTTRGDSFFMLYGHHEIVPGITPGVNVHKNTLLGHIQAFYNAGELLPHLHLGIYTAKEFPANHLGYGPLMKDWEEPDTYLKEHCWSFIQ